MRGGEAKSRGSFADSERGDGRVRRASYPAAESPDKEPLRLPALRSEGTTPQRSPRRSGALPGLPSVPDPHGDGYPTEGGYARSQPSSRQSLPPNTLQRASLGTSPSRAGSTGTPQQPFSAGTSTAGGPVGTVGAESLGSSMNDTPAATREQLPSMGASGAAGGAAGTGSDMDGGKPSPADAELERVIRRMSHPPLTLLLYLQSAPPKVIFSAFQSECEDWGVPWYSGTAQRIAVYLFLRHPVSARYPPRSTTLRALLKQYISLMEQPELSALRREEAGARGEDPVELELMEAYIELSVTMDGGEQSMCYKSYYNMYADDAEAGSAAAADLMLQHMMNTGGGAGGASEVQREARSSSASSALLPDAGAVRGGGSSGHHGEVPSAHGLLLAPHLSASSAVPTAGSSSELPPAQTVRAGVGGDVGITITSPPAPGSSNPFFEGKNALFETAPSASGDSGECPAEAAVLACFCPLRVATGQFSNVGLSLWPAASVLVQLLAQEATGRSRLVWPRLFPNTPWPPPEPLPARQRLRILELGAGVGLTPALLNSLRAYRDCVDRFVVTDYQPQLLENIKENLRINRVTEVTDFRAAERGLEGDKPRPHHLVARMDWTRTAQNEASLIDWGSNLILAADCIYDVEVIPALVETIRLALSAPSTDSIFEYTQAMRSHSGVDAGTQQRAVVVVQTHRQNSTMKQFFDRLKPFATVQSFTLVTAQSAAELLAVERLSEHRDGQDGGLVPLGEWPALSEHEDTASGLSGSCDSGLEGLDTRDMPNFRAAASRPWELPFGGVCALRPDTVLEDGSLASLAGGAVHPPSSSTQPRPGPGSTDPSHLLPPSPGRGLAARNRSPRLSPQSSLLPTRTSSCVSLGGGGAASRVEAMLRDEWMGAFYTPMAGLIGVHILQLREGVRVGSLFGAERQAGGRRRSGGGGSSGGDGRGDESGGSPANGGGRKRKGVGFVRRGE